MAGYVAFVDHRLSGAARKEIAAILPDCHMTPYRISGRAVLLRMETDAAKAAERMNAGTFVDFAFREDSSVQGCGTEKICDAVARLAVAEGIRAIRLEAKNVDARLGASAKAVEVAIGQELERRGVEVDLANPKTIFYGLRNEGSVTDPAAHTHFPNRTHKVYIGKVRA